MSVNDDAVKDDPGGTVIALGGPGYGILGSTRLLSHKGSIISKTQEKIFPLNKTMALAAVGKEYDVTGLVSAITYRQCSYEDTSPRAMTAESMGHMISIAMYYRRFQPYLLNPILCGLDVRNCGIICSYDAVGHFKTTQSGCIGTSACFVQPVLDRHFCADPMNTNLNSTITCDEAKQIIIDCFKNILLHDTSGSTSIGLHIIKPTGVEKEVINLFEKPKECNYKKKSKNPKRKPKPLQRRNRREVGDTAEDWLCDDDDQINSGSS